MHIFVLTYFIHPSFYTFFFFTKYSFTPHWENDQLLLDAYYTAFAEAGGPASYTKEQFESDVFIACMDAVASNLNNMRKTSGGITANTLTAWENDPKQADLKLGQCTIHNNCLDRLCNYIENRPEWFVSGTKYGGVESASLNIETKN